MIMISVIIVTKNRDSALRNISLPSLLAQDIADFEVIIWDASENDKSENIAGDFASLFTEKGIHFRYFRAPRVGSASQRNDSVKASVGNIIFFIDDDSEVSSDGIASLAKCFEEHPACMGAGLQLKDDQSETNQYLSLKKRMKEGLYALFGYVRKRIVHPSGSNKGLKSPPGPAEWLSGCSMAFRREVFDSMSLNEKLETFGGYAMSEDVEFSHRVFLRYGTPLLVPSEGYVIHHEVPDARESISEKKIAMFFYNRYLVMQVAAVRAPFWGRVAFVWNFLRRSIKMFISSGFGVTLNGILLALHEIFEYKKGSHADIKKLERELPK